MARRCLLLVVGALAVLAANAALAAQSVAEFVVNGVPKGMRFIDLQADGWYLSAADLKELGLTLARAPGERTLQGAAWVRLNDLPDVRVTIDAGRQEVRLDAAPALLGTQTLVANSLGQPAQADYATSFFANYDVSYLGSGYGGGQFVATTSQGLRVGKGLLFNEMSWLPESGGNRFVRIGTSLAFDWPETLARLTLGDISTAAGGEFGQAIRLGGVSFRRSFDMWPTLVTTPMPGFSGETAVSGEVEVYLDGVRVYTGRLSPGRFDIENLTRASGLRQVEVIVRDASGRVVSRQSGNAYYAAQLLRAGLSEFEYAAGAARSYAASGLESGYSKLAFVAMHRYGVTDELTLGAHADGLGSYLTAGVDAGVQIGVWGVVTASLGVAHSESKGLTPAGSLRYNYSRERFSLAAGYKKVGAGYLGGANAVASGLPVPVLEEDLAASMSYTFVRGGTMTLASNRSVYRDQSAQVFSTLAYSYVHGGQWGLDGVVGFTTGERNPWGGPAGWTASLNFTWYFKDRTSAAVRYRNAPGEPGVFEAQASRIAPVGEGVGWRVSAQSEGSRGVLVQPSGAWNTRVGTLYGNVSASSREGSRAAWQAGFAGSVVYADSTWALTRPVFDAFAIAVLADVEGASVFQNGQELGRTDRRGVLAVPSLGAYTTSRLTVDDQNLPMDSFVRQITRPATPALRGGTRVDFVVERERFASGHARWNGGPLHESPVALAHGLLQSAEGTVLELATTTTGRFFLEQPAAGTYVGRIASRDGECHVQVTVPPGSETQIDLGILDCTRAPAPRAPGAPQ